MTRMLAPTILAILIPVVGFAGDDRSLDRPQWHRERSPVSESQPTRPFDVQVSGSGRPVILIPGLASGGDVWTETVDHFQNRYECHVLTLAGFAGQPPIEFPLLPKYRDGLLQYIANHEPHRPILVGHSLGGFLALWVAATRPDSVGPVISVDGLPFYSALDDPKATPQSVDESARRRRKLIQNASPVRSMIQNRAYLASRVSSSDDLKRVAEESNRSDPQTVGQAMYEMLTTDIRGELARIQVPVLLIGAAGANSDDEKLRIKTRRYRQQVATIADHRVLFHPESRHFIQLDDPEWLWDQMQSYFDECESRCFRNNDW